MQNANDQMVVIDHFTKKYGSNIAVDDVSLSIPRGSFFGILGPNGAGKSTTIGATIGTVNSTSGSITVGGYDVVREYRKTRSMTGISPQEFNVDIFEKVHLILDYMGGFYGVPKKQRMERVEELLTRFDLQEHRDKMFMELSGGLKRRVVLAKALVHDPELLILDEPTAGIDVEQRRDLWSYLTELNKEGKTIVMTSHYLEEVEKLCDRIAVINHGKIVAEGTKEEFTKDDTLEETYLKITKKDKPEPV